MPKESSSRIVTQFPDEWGNEQQKVGHKYWPLASKISPIGKEVTKVLFEEEKSSSFAASSFNFSSLSQEKSSKGTFLLHIFFQQSS